ncbi:HAMP domain-containing sensor histidine kinase [Eubacterium sp. 1001713B170207_170306_E7]|uniref:sensor histidine kinase n=1 Tax=Eubacterium sp. 1001713B170207_170306_E7 TaxID=2787097 RepID=UPI0018991CF0|nr:HAMP domain-containing sensor histidine kinase [Eubacterium sp. 1001713B170207_170306_E7]
MSLILIFFIALSAVLLALLLLERRSLSRLRDDLSAINRASDDTPNRRLALPAPGRPLEELVHEINTLMDQKQAVQVESLRREQELRRQIANISHDLRTPLTAILGYTQLLKEPALSDGDRAEYLAVVEKRSHTLQTLLTGFYDLSRMESSEYSLSLCSVALHPVLCELLAAFYEDFTDKAVRLQADLEENLPEVTADPGAVTRIFTNLIQNALRHGGQHLEIRQYAEENAVVTAFTNEAGSLTGQDIASIFDRFFTADRMRTGQNTGLGLAIVKNLVEAMGHQITASLDGPLFSIRIYWKRI